MLGPSAAILLLSASVAQVSLPVCRPFDQPTFAKMATAIESEERSDMRKTWRAWSRNLGGAVVPRAADLSFRVQRNRSPSDPSYELQAWRVGEAWHMQARTGRTYPKPETRWTPWQDIQINQSRAEKLNELTVDPCLWSAPRYLSANVPGNTMFTEVILLLDVRRRGQRWGGMQLSAAAGRPAELASLALNWAFDLPPVTPGWPDR